MNYISAAFFPRVGLGILLSPIYVGFCFSIYFGEIGVKSKVNLKYFSLMKIILSIATKPVLF